MFVGGNLMTTGMFFTTVFEVVLVGFTVWAVFHENKFIDFEDRLFSRIRRRNLKVIKGSGTARTTHPSVQKTADNF